VLVGADDGAVDDQVFEVGIIQFLIIKSSNHYIPLVDLSSAPLDELITLLCILVCWEFFEVEFESISRFSIIHSYE
jgi:hypothetical protein